MQEQLVDTEWLLVNADSFPYSGLGSTSDLHHFRVSKSNVLTLVYCYVAYSYLVVEITEKTLLLLAITNGESGSQFRLERAECTPASNQFNDPKRLSFVNGIYRLVIEDSIGVSATLIDPFNKMILLDAKMNVQLNNFILDNRHNDSHMDFFVFKTTANRVGVISSSEKIAVPPTFKQVVIDYDHIVMKDGHKYSIPIVCTDFRGVTVRKAYYY